MRVVIVHGEARRFAGPERMLVSLVEELGKNPTVEVVLAAVRDSPLAVVVSDRCHTVWISSNARFSLADLVMQLRQLSRAHQEDPFSLVHGWAARDWDLCGLARWRLDIPALGTLHDHPETRQGNLRSRLMRSLARYALDRVVCVSEAVRAECVRVGYPPSRVEVVCDGLPADAAANGHVARIRPFRCGFLGVFSVRKGFRELFALMQEFYRRSEAPWELYVAGGALDQEDQDLALAVTREFITEPWWDRVRWLGWIQNPEELLSSIDLLIVPSTGFDPFPTVLLEAGRCGVAALAASVGGIPEIIRENETGWFFDPASPAAAADLLVHLAERPDVCAAVGRRAAARLRDVLSIENMAAGYTQLYTALAKHDDI